MKRKMWCIIEPDGGLCWHIATGPRLCIGYWLESDSWGWKTLYRAGYRCLPCIVIVDDKLLKGKKRAKKI